MIFYGQNISKQLEVLRLDIGQEANNYLCKINSYMKFHSSRVTYYFLFI